MIGVGVCAETQVFIWLSGFHVWAGCCLCHLFRLQNRSLLTQSRMCRTSQALPLVCPLCFSSALVKWHRVQSACVCVCWILFIVKDDRWNKLTHTFIEIWKKQQQKNVLGHLLCSLCVCVFVCICVYPPSGVFCSNSRFHPPKTVHHFEVCQSPSTETKRRP